MAHSHTSINIHYIFAPHNRCKISSEDKRKMLYKYITGICHNLSCLVLAAYVMPDHVHLLLKIPAKISIAELAQKIKSNSSKHLNEQPDRFGGFEWQVGYGAFSCSYSSLEAVIHYINHQPEHHAKMDYTQEYQAFLEKHQI